MWRSVSGYALAAGLVLGVAWPAWGQEPEAEVAEAESVSLTVYSTAEPAEFDPQRFIAQQRHGYDPNFVWEVPGFGVVRSVREVELEEGENALRLTDVAQFIDPTTVSIVAMDEADGLAVLEQQFEFDLVSPQKLLERFVDREVTLLVPAGDGPGETVTGELLSTTQNQLVLRTDEGLRMVPHSDEVQVLMDDLPGGLITKPTLSWLLQSEAAGARRLRTSYQTDGITWRADYNMILNEDETAADLGAWVTLLNLSGTSYPNAELKLIAGDVQRVEPRGPEPMMRRQQMEAVAMDRAAAFEQEPFFEYHLYTLPRRTDVPQNATKQLTLFPTAEQVEVEKVLVYYGVPEQARWGHFPDPRVDREFGTQMNRDIDVYIRFQNEAENNLGMPLPRGKFRVYQENPNDGALEFVGEDLIDHTPRGEELMVKVGESFDVVGERVQTQFNRAGRMVEETFEIELRNQQDEAARVIVKENLYRWVNWEITEASDEYEPVDARTIHFDVEVPAGGEKVVQYTVRYTW